MNEEQLQDKIDKLYAKMGSTYDDAKMDLIHRLTVEKKGIQTRKIKGKNYLDPSYGEIVK